jgi:hypothetical protein
MTFVKRHEKIVSSADFRSVVGHALMIKIEVPILPP